MTSPTAKPRLDRSKRREALIKNIGTMLGCSAVIVTVAAGFKVFVRKLWQRPPSAPTAALRQPSAGRVPDAIRNPAFEGIGRLILQNTKSPET